MTRFVLAAIIAAVLVQRDVPESDLLRGFAFSKCLAEGYKGRNDSFAQDARHVAELYRDAGRTSRPDVYTRLQALAQSAKPGEPAAIDQSNLTIMKCLELYEGAALKKLVKSETAR
ncbi:MAG TPA: T6SS amidase immunity protein Tai4 family protein [Polyangia bacterium]|nr:T6SS amidase immunity protein Tai4 family protein [Polyangia bacterium]